MTLADVRAGQTVRVEKIDDQSIAVQRLMTLGVIEGVTLSLIRRSLGGDPLEIRLYGSSLSLRRAQARCIQVTEA